MLPLPKPVPQILFYGGIVGVLSSASSFRYFGDLTLGVAPEKYWGWNADQICQSSVPNGWWSYPGTCGSSNAPIVQYYNKKLDTDTPAFSWDVFVAALKLGNGGPTLWSNLTSTTCENNFPGPFECWALVPLELAIVLGALGGGYKL